MEVLTITLSMVSFVISVICGLISFGAWVELRSFMKSTHKVEFVPMDGVDIKKEPKVNDELEQYDLI